MKNRTLILSLSVVAILALAAVSFAGPGQGRGYHMGGGYGMMGDGSRMGGYGQAANLTDDQRAALEKTAQDFAARTEPLRADLYAKNLELAAELAKSAPDQSRIASLTREVNDLRSELFTQRVAFRSTLAKDYGIRGGFGMGRHMGYGMMGQGMAGQGDCPFRGPSAATDDNAN